MDKDYLENTEALVKFMEDQYYSIYKKEIGLALLEIEDAKRCIKLVRSIEKLGKE